MQHTHHKRVVIVGAGLGGLSAAAYARAQGHDVTILESALVPGGRAGIIESQGYRLDTGPCVLTMTGILSDVFRVVGANMNDHVAIEPLDPMYRAVFDESEGGGELRVRHGREAMADEIARFAGRSEAEGFHRFADWVSELYRVEMPAFIDRNFDSPLDMARPLKPGLQLLKLGGFAKLSNLVEKYFRDPRLQKIFSFQAMYAGLSPFEALGAYAVITYMDTIAGVYFPKGGMHAIAVGLAEAVTEAGVKIRYNATAERVIRASGTNGAVRGVRLSGGEIMTADVVVVNADLPVAYRSLLPELDAPRVARRGQYSPSCALWLAGVRATLPEGAEHHNIHFGAKWRDSFDALLDRGTRMSDPSLLVTVPSKTDRSLVPKTSDDSAESANSRERHSLYVLEPTPHLGGKINWDTERTRVRDDIVARVQRLGYVASESDIELERFYDPNDWERAGMAMGTPFALAHTFFQTGPFRPNNIDKRVPGLVFTGSSTVPGVGVPMVLLSGRLAGERIADIA